MRKKVSLKVPYRGKEEKHTSPVMKPRDKIWGSKREMYHLGAGMGKDVWPPNSHMLRKWNPLYEGPEEMLSDYIPFLLFPRILGEICENPEKGSLLWVVFTTAKEEARCLQWLPCVSPVALRQGVSSCLQPQLSWPTSNYLLTPSLVTADSRLESRITGLTISYKNYMLAVLARKGQMWVFLSVLISDPMVLASWEAITG